MIVKDTFKYKISVFVIWLFTISGVIGILSPYSDWFLSMTPLNLILYFIIILLNLKTFHKHLFLAFSIPFLLGFITEALGVNYGLVYGSYSYGGNLGPKIIGVPFLICINWVVLTVASSDIARSITKNKWVSVVLGALLMTALDVLIEVSAPRFDFWEFENGIVPLQNYIGWFVTSLLAHAAYQNLNVKTNRPLSWHVYISIAVFFGVFIFV
ncbi:MAG: carotenoid biosynthesis protein [Bacteroidia bacterium]|nr:carotenoid biosynthesis protein [Bacteroidia bacterium]